MRTGNGVSRRKIILLKILIATSILLDFVRGFFFSRRSVSLEYKSWHLLLQQEKLLEVNAVMHLRMCAVIAENVTDSASAVAGLTRPSSHRHFLRASWGAHTSCSFYVPFDTSSLPIKTGTITAQTFLPGNGAIFVSEIRVVMHPALNSRAVRLETRQMPILALLPLWIADAFTYWKTECQSCFVTALVSIEKKRQL